MVGITYCRRIFFKLSNKTKQKMIKIKNKQEGQRKKQIKMEQLIKVAVSKKQ